MLNCIDNSGAAVVECVNVLKKKSPATIGVYCLTDHLVYKINLLRIQ